MRKVWGQAVVYVGSSADNERKVLVTGTVSPGDHVDDIEAFEDGEELSFDAVLCDIAGGRGASLDDIRNLIETEIIEDAWEREESRRDAYWDDKISRWKDER